MAAPTALLTKAPDVRGRSWRRDRSLTVILAVAAVLRLGWAAVAGLEQPETWVSAGDQYSYWYYGEEIAAGRGYLSYTTGDATAYYPIGYPATLAALFFLQDHTPLPDGRAGAVAVLHAVLGVITVWLVFTVASRVAGRRAGLAAAAVAAVFPNLILYTTTFALETTFIAAALAALAVVVTHDWSTVPSLPRLAAFGGALGMAATVRPFALPFVVGVGVALALAGATWRRWLGSMAVIALAIGAVVLPWAVRNAIALDAFVPFSTNLGDTACLDRTVGATGRFQWAAHEHCADPDLPEVERNRENLASALRFVVEHPGEEARLVWRRLVRLVAHDHSGLEELEGVREERVLDGSARRAVTAAADWFFYAAGVAGAAGLAVLCTGWRARPQRAIVVVAALALLVIPLGLWGNPRFHVPLLPFLAVGVGTLAALAERRVRPAS